MSKPKTKVNLNKESNSRYLTIREEQLKKHFLGKGETLSTGKMLPKDRKTARDNVKQYIEKVKENNERFSNANERYGTSYWGNLTTRQFRNIYQSELKQHLKNRKKGKTLITKDLETGEIIIIKD